MRPGLWAIPVPIPDNPLGHTNVYAFDTDAGPVLIDAGWDDPTSWQALVDGLTMAQMSVEDCYGVLVTHAHADHHGLSGRVREASGAWVAMHPADAATLPKATSDRPSADYRAEVAAMLIDAGAGEHELVVPIRPSSGRVRAPLVQPDRTLDDGMDVDVPGWRVQAVWTPGHSPGHTCFRVPDDGLLLAGDHVLPTITPHIGMSRSDRHGDPLGDYLASLAKVDTADVTLVLPAHERRFGSLSTRVAEITAHHREHLAVLVGELAEGPRTLWQLAQTLGWNRPWDQLDQMMQRAAVNETAAHLRHLVRLGHIERIRGVRPITFRASR